MIRVCTLLAIAVSIGLLLSAKIPPLPPITFNQLHVAYSAIFISQTVVSISLFASFGVLRAQREDRYTKLMLTLPIPERRVWGMLLLPAVIICLLSTALFGPLVCNLLGQLGIPLFANILILGISNLSALGLAFGLKKGIMTYAAVPCFYLVEYKLLAYLHGPYGSPLNEVLILSIISTLFILCICLLGCSQKHLLDEARSAARTTFICTPFLPSSFWVVRKIMRTSSLRVGFCITFTLAAVLVIIGKKLAIHHEMYWGVCGALITAVLAADLRTITRRYKPPEIFCLKGTRAFEYSQLMGGVCFCLLATTPILTMSYMVNPDPIILWNCTLMILFGISAGFFAGSLIAPEPHDVMAQMSATLLSIGLLSLLYLVQDISILSVPLVLLATIILLIIGGIAIEYKRNHFYWKEIHG